MRLLHLLVFGFFASTTLTASPPKDATKKYHRVATQPPRVQKPIAASQAVGTYFRGASHQTMTTCIAFWRLAYIEIRNALR